MIPAGTHPTVDRDVIDGIVDLYDAMLRLRPAPDAFETVGRGFLAERIAGFVAAGRVIEWVLPGFAHKNPNRAKTLGALPDLAEEAALSHLEAFCAAVDALYRPPGHVIGCRLILVSDGRVWGDLMGVSDETARAYGIGLRAMAARRPHLRVVGLDDLIETPTAAAIEARFATGPIIARVEAGLADPTSNLGRAAARFARLAEEDDLPALRALGPAAAMRRMFVRHMAFGALVDARFPDCVRLSVHARDDGGPQLSCRFAAALPAVGETPRLPYHGAALRPAGGGPIRVVAVAEGLRAGATIERREDHPWCLRAPRRTES